MRIERGAAPIEEEVADLSAALAGERARLRVPGHEALWTAISEPTGRAVTKLITRIERERPELFGRYGSLEELYVAIVDVFDHEQPSVSSAADLFGALEAVAEETWVIASPLANLMPPAKLDPLGPKLALVAASSQHGDWFQIREEVNAHFGCDFHQLDSRLEHDRDKKIVDTRRGAWLLSEEHGSLEASKQRAMVRAQLVLATWTLLKPPHNEMYMPLWPVASEWLPQPHLHIMQRSVGVGASGRERNQTVIYDDDELALYHPPEDTLRRAPMVALERVATHPAAVRLLAAAWSLYRGIEALSGRAWELRNIGVHSADAVLISLGYPPERRQRLRSGPPIPGSELAPLHVREGVEAPFAAAHLAATRLWKLMLECDFDDGVWEEQFSGSLPTN